MCTAEEAMLNFNTRTVHSLFLDTIADAQAAGSSAVDGFVPVVVPCHQGVDAASNDLSWTSVRHYLVFVIQLSVSVSQVVLAALVVITS